jgi:hypothetical protein
MFLKSVDAFDQVKDAQLLFCILDEVVVEVGVENVAWVIGDNASSYPLMPRSNLWRTCLMARNGEHGPNFQQNKTSFNKIAISPFTSTKYHKIAENYLLYPRNVHPNQQKHPQKTFSKHSA